MIQSGMMALKGNTVYLAAIAIYRECDVVALGGIFPNFPSKRKISSPKDLFVSRFSDLEISSNGTTATTHSFVFRKQPVDHVCIVLFHKTTISID